MKDNDLMAFYLKVNRENSYVIPNLKHWLDIAMWYENSFVYIVCDNQKQKEKILAEIPLDDKRVSFLESYRGNEEINIILNYCCNEEKWIRAGQAHLTTYWHSKLKSYKYFWNIDADDTFVCLHPMRVAEMLKKVEDYSIKNNIHMNGLDMWRSVSKFERWSEGDHWSLGITFVNNQVDWSNILLQHCKDVGFRNKINLDCFFTYLKDIHADKIETFYFENLKFMHFFSCFIEFPHKSSFCHWRNGKIEYPILKNCFGTKFEAEVPIAEDILRFDIGITEDEGFLALVPYSQEKFCFYRDLKNKELKVDHVMKRLNEIFMNKIEKKELVFWGAGRNFNQYYELIRKAYDLKYVCDNDPEKWGKNLRDDVLCISPDELKKMEDVYVIVLVGNVGINYKIIHQLLDMGITSFDCFDNWLDIVEGIY